MTSSSSFALATRRRRPCLRHRSRNVLVRIAAGERPVRPRWPQWAGPSLAIVIAAAVAVSSARLISRPPRCGTTWSGDATYTAGHPKAGPCTAMRGSLQSPVLGFGPAGTGVIAWTQFRAASTVHPKPWLATTSDAGRSWSGLGRSFSLFATPVFDGSRDGWTQGVDSSQALRFYVTHDGGRSWTPAQSAAAADSVEGDVSVAGGVVWAVGTGSAPAAGVNGRDARACVRRPSFRDRGPAASPDRSERHHDLRELSNGRLRRLARPTRHRDLCDR